MTDERRIITPQEFRSRQQRRAGLVEVNKRLVRELDLRNRTIREQAGSIKAMNTVFTHIAERLGTPVPRSAEEGKAALDAMMARIDDLTTGKNE